MPAALNANAPAAEAVSRSMKAVMHPLTPKPNHSPIAGEGFRSLRP
jgi:hypothetical protein